LYLFSVTVDSNRFSRLYLEMFPQLWSASFSRLSIYTQNSHNMYSWNHLILQLVF
jgi:hypothetical protein